MKGGSNFQGGTPQASSGLDYLSMSSHFGSVPHGKMQPTSTNPQQQNPFMLNVTRHAGQNIPPNRGKVQQ